MSDLKRFIGWFNPEYIPVDVGQSVECAIANTTFGYDMDTTVLYLFNDELPTGLNISDLVQIQSKIDEFLLYPIMYTNDHPYNIISRWQQTVTHLRERTPQSSAVKTRRKILTDSNVQTDPMSTESVDDEAEKAAQIHKDEIDLLIKEKDLMANQIEVQSTRINEVPKHDSFLGRCLNIILVERAIGSCR